MRHVILHIPHASTFLPSAAKYLIDPTDELNRVTDFFTDEMISAADDAIVFRYSRLYCDVERLEDDPLEKEGRGLFYTHTLDGKPLRVFSQRAYEEVKQTYWLHHHQLECAIEQVISLLPVVLIDLHSFSNEQARLSGETEFPDICIGYNAPMSTRRLLLIEDLERFFTKVGYRVARNKPFCGALEPDYYKQRQDFEAVMIEINKALYLTDDFQKSDGWERLQTNLDAAVEMIRLSN